MRRTHGRCRVAGKCAECAPARVAELAFIDADVALTAVRIGNTTRALGGECQVGLIEARGATLFGDLADALTIGTVTAVGHTWIDAPVCGATTARLTGVDACLPLADLTVTRVAAGVFAIDAVAATPARPIDALLAAGAL